MVRKHRPRQHEGHEQKKDAGRADDALGLGVVATPHRDGGQRRPAHARQKREGRNNEDDGKGDAEPRQRQWPDVRYPAHKDAVHDVVEKVDDLGQDTGHGKAHEEPAERLGRPASWRNPEKPLCRLLSETCAAYRGDAAARMRGAQLKTPASCKDTGKRGTLRSFARRPIRLSGKRTCP